jgi:glucose-6-phosphate 1-dehydrogenase
MFHLADDMPIKPNLLSICIQPDEGIHLRFEAKTPDSDQALRSVYMDFHYSSSFKEALPDAYERLILDALQKDASLFIRSDGIVASWRLIDPVIQGWTTKQDVIPLSTYKRDTNGPIEAENLIHRDGRDWRFGCSEHEANHE